MWQFLSIIIAKFTFKHNNSLKIGQIIKIKFSCEKIIFFKYKNNEKQMNWLMQSMSEYENINRNGVVEN